MPLTVSARGSSGFVEDSAILFFVRYRVSRHDPVLLDIEQCGSGWMKNVPVDNGGHIKYWKTFMTALRNKRVAYLAFLLLCHLSQGEATQILELDVCDGSRIFDLSFPIPNGCGTDNLSTDTSLKITMTLTVAPFASPPASSPAGSASFSWENSGPIDVFNGVNLVKIADCQALGADPGAVVSLSTSVAAPLQVWQQNLDTNAKWRPEVVVNLSAEWRLSFAGEEAPEVLGSDEIIATARACAKRVRFPLFVNNGTAIVTRNSPSSGPPTHEIFRSDPTSSKQLTDETGVSQVVLASPGAALQIGPNVGVAARPPIPVKLSFWVLDGKTKVADVDKEFSAVLAIFEHAGSGITFEKSFFRDISADPAIGGLWAETCPLPPKKITGICAVASPVITCHPNTCVPGCKTVTPTMIANTTLIEGIHPFDGDAINIYFVPSSGSAGSSAQACSASSNSCWEPQPAGNVILVSALLPGFPGRLAHELGHTLGLGHSAFSANYCTSADVMSTFSNNVMNVEFTPGTFQPLAGTELSLGQILQTHTDANSQLRTRLDGLPPNSQYRLPTAITGTCAMTSSSNGNVGPCIPLYFDADANRSR